MIVRAVGARTPAGRAGLQPGDIIVAIDDAPTRTASELLRILRERKPGDTIRISVVRLDDQGRLAGKATIAVRLAGEPVE